MGFQLSVALLYFGGTVFFYLSAMLGVYPPYFLCALLYFAGSVILFYLMSLARRPESVILSPFCGPHFATQHNENLLFYRKTDRFGIQSDDSKICVVMVGLPARGKSLIAGKGTLYHVTRIRLVDVSTDRL